jgi:enoyl-CoA hydratase
MEYQCIRYQPGKVARVILARPRYRNAQSRLLLEELDDAFECSAADDEVHVIVLSGEGDHFSAGHDLGTPEEKADQEARGFPTEGRGVYRRLRRLYLENTMRWRNLQKPTIAMVQGYCIYGGWMIASAMDIVFASEDALFLPSHFQYFSTPWDIGPRKAKEVIFEHRFITAREARDQHFVNRVYHPEKLEEETLAYASRVAENDPFVMRSAKFSINHMMDTMGFEAEVEVAFQTYFINRYLDWSEYTKPVYEGRRLARSDTALKNLELSYTQL